MHARAAAAVGATLQPRVRSRRRLFGNVLSEQDVRSAAEAERMRSTSRTAPPGYSPVLEEEMEFGTNCASGRTCAALTIVMAAAFSMAHASATSAQERSKSSGRVSCRPTGENGSVLPYLPTDATLKCEIFLMWRQDCKQSTFYDPTGSYPAYCFSPQPP